MMTSESIQDLKASLWVSEEKVRLAEGETRTLQSDYNMLEEEYQALALDYKSARARANDAESELEGSQQARSQLEMERAQLEADNAELQQQLRTAREALADGNKRMDSVQQQNKHMLKQIVNMVAERDSLADMVVKATVGEKRPRSGDEPEFKRCARRIVCDDVFAAHFNEHGKLELKAPGPVATPYAVRVIQRERAPKVYYILVQDQEPLYCRSFRHMLQTMRAIARV